MKKQKTLLVVDGLNYLHRGYWAINYKLTNKDGNPTSAIRGLLAILLADLVFVEATHCAVVFDRGGKNFRHKLYSDYKATRPTSDVDLHSQVRPAKELLNAMGIRVFGSLGKEGDDLIGSIAVSAYETSKKSKAQIYIGSRDKDFASLVNDRIHLLHPQKEILDAQGVEDKWGVPPNQMVEYLMLLGDKVDNIPGVNKVGAKTAAKILNNHGDIKTWLKTKMTPAMAKNVAAVRKFFPMSRKLITIKTDFYPDLRFNQLALNEPDEQRIVALCEDLDFDRMLKQIQTTLKKLG